MVATQRGEHINGVDVDELRGYIEAVDEDSAKADRDPVVVAHWLGGTRAEVAAAAGGPAMYLGGDDDPSAMGMLLRTLAACDIEVVANKGALLGVATKELSVEARGHFNIRRYLGFEAEEDSGYQAVSYTIRLKTNGATEEQLEEIRCACEGGWPPADTLRRAVPVQAEFEIS